MCLVLDEKRREKSLWGDPLWAEGSLERVAPAVGMARGQWQRSAGPVPFLSKQILSFIDSDSTGGIPRCCWGSELGDGCVCFLGISEAFL
eukprot:s2902_g2.t1